MNITGTYQISKEDFEEIYRAHCHYKFHLRRSMYLSVALLVFGVTMEQGFAMDLGWVNTMDSVLFVISLLCNLFCDFYLPKEEYKRFHAQKKDQGVISIQEDILIYGEGSQAVSKEWNQFKRCLETRKAFLLYQGDMFSILWKEACGEQVDEVRTLLSQKINHGRPIITKK